jgi:hypothetical protein
MRIREIAMTRSARLRLASSHPLPVVVAAAMQSVRVRLRLREWALHAHLGAALGAASAWMRRTERIAHDEAYLAESADLCELELRMRHLDRRSPGLFR